MSNSPSSTNRTDMFNIEDIDDTNYNAILDEMESFDIIDTNSVDGIDNNYYYNNNNNVNNENENQDTFHWATYRIFLWLTFLFQSIKDVIFLIYELDLLIATIVYVWCITSYEECDRRTGCFLSMVLNLVMVLSLSCIEGCITGIVRLFNTIVSTTVLGPLLFTWSKLCDFKNRITSIIIYKRMKIWCTFILLFFSCIPFYTYAKPYISVFMNDMSFNFNYPGSSYTDIMQALNTLQKENVKLWTEIGRIREELSQQNIILHRHGEIINGIEDTVREAIEEKLPEQIFVKSGKNGQLELSPSFMTSFQSSLFWNNFLKQNSIQIQSMTSSSVDKYLQQQQKDGVIIDKKTFIKLLSNALMPYHNDNEDTELNFQSLIDAALVKYHQDVLNKADFALASRGAFSLVSLTSLTWYPLPVWVQVLSNFVGFTPTANSPDTALMPDNHVGACWRMYGDIGTFGISLSEKVRVNAIAIEYPSKEVILDMSTAPKNVQVFGIEDFNKKTERWSLLGDFEYDINKGEPIQVFDTIDLATSFKIIVVKVNSNWGHKEYTDFYRVRVHGEPVS